MRILLKLADFLDTNRADDLDADDEEFEDCEDMEDEEENGEDGGSGAAQVIDIDVQK